MLESIPMAFDSSIFIWPASASCTRLTSDFYFIVPKLLRMLVFYISRNWAKLELSSTSMWI